MKSIKTKVGILTLIMAFVLITTACGAGDSYSDSGVSDSASSEVPEKAEKSDEERPTPKSKDAKLKRLADAMGLRQNVKDSFVHGEKGSEYQKYIVLHDTEGGDTADSVIQGWLNDGNYIAAHFIINKDGTVVQCVPIDKIGHHAGFGNEGHNEKFGVNDESRDDKRGTIARNGLPDYGMNSYSVGIEMIHQGDEVYPEAQLVSLDNLIAYIDTYYGFESTIIDHKMWRIGNSDTSNAFETYLSNYRDHRTHN